MTILDGKIVYQDQRPNSSKKEIAKNDSKVLHFFLLTQP